MKAGLIATGSVDRSFGVGGLETVGAVPEDGGSEDGGPPSVIGVSVRCGS